MLSLHFSAAFGTYEESRSWVFGLLYLKDAFFTDQRQSSQCH